MVLKTILDVVTLPFFFFFFFFFLWLKVLRKIIVATKISGKSFCLDPKPSQTMVVFVFWKKSFLASSVCTVQTREEV
ncbi:hypothetical protein HanIR_Chr13g0641951 [Helianthus annuus]|nr:hypothetical protein HanIR_Chr13g0641951 [Helianthus annuus]